MSQHLAVQQILSRYVRAADRRDGVAMSALFVPAGRVEVAYRNAGTIERLGELVGRQVIAEAVANMMKPHPPRGWSHHTTHDALIDIDGDHATIDAQFVVFESVGHEAPLDGWPQRVSGVQGTITPTESGYYKLDLQLIESRWLIEVIRIEHDLPMTGGGRDA